MPDTTYSSVSLPPTVFVVGVAWNGNGHTVLSGGSYSVTPPSDSGNNAVHVLDRHRGGLWNLKSDGTNLTVNPWRLNGSGVWTPTSDVAAGAGKSPSLQAPGTGALSAVYVDGGSVKRGIWKPGASAFAHVQTLGAGTLADHCYDRAGRCVVAAYNSGWGIYVGEPGNAAWTFSFQGPVSMGLSSQARRAVILPRPGSGFVFGHVNGSGTVEVYHCRKLAKTGAGTWSLLASIGAGTRVAMAFDRAGRLVVARYTGGGWTVRVGVPNGSGYTFGASTAMGITETERGAHLLAMGGILSFLHAGDQREECRSLSQAGVGSWS